MEVLVLIVIVSRGPPVLAKSEERLAQALAIGEKRGLSGTGQDLMPCKIQPIGLNCVSACVYLQYMHIHSIVVYPDESMGSLFSPSELLL